MQVALRDAGAKMVTGPLLTLRCAPNRLDRRIGSCSGYDWRAAAHGCEEFWNASLDVSGYCKPLDEESPRRRDVLDCANYQYVREPCEPNDRTWWGEFKTAVLVIAVILAIGRVLG